LGISTRATSASKNKVFSSDLDNMVDDKIKQVSDTVGLKKNFEKTRIELKC
jgi:hypothetical protein